MKGNSPTKKKTNTRHMYAAVYRLAADGHVVGRSRVRNPAPLGCVSCFIFIFIFIFIIFIFIFFIISKKKIIPGVGALYFLLLLLFLFFWQLTTDMSVVTFLFSTWDADEASGSGGGVRLVYSVAK